MICTLLGHKAVPIKTFKSGDQHFVLSKCSRCGTHSVAHVDTTTSQFAMLRMEGRKV